MRFASRRSAWSARRALAAACLAVAVTLAIAACDSSSVGTRVKVTIPPGASLRTAADSLHRAGLVAWPRLFRLYAKTTSDDRGIKAGTYTLKRGESWTMLIHALRDGEGWADQARILLAFGAGAGDEGDGA